MSWRDKVKEYYQRAAAKVVSWGGSALLLFPATTSAHSDAESSMNQKKVDHIEANIAADDVSAEKHSLVFNPTIYQPMSRLDVDKVTEAVAQMSFAEVLEKGLITEKDIQEYHFSAEDFKQMKPSALGKKLETVLARTATGRPRGDCLSGVRKAVAKAWKFDVWTHSGEAKEWPQRVAETDMPVVFLGKVSVVNKDGQLEDKGNIKREDLKYLQDALVVIDGNMAKHAEAQPAGHVSLVTARFDAKGNLLRTESRCDGLEDYAKVVDTKIGGGQCRYGNEAAVMVPNDTQISAGLADYVAQKLIERSDNALDICRAIDKEHSDTEKYLYAHTPSFLYTGSVSERVEAARNRLAAMAPSEVKAAKAGNSRENNLAAQVRNRQSVRS